MDTSDVIQVTAIAISLTATVVTTAAATLLTLRMAREEKADTKRQFCFELQRQFDSPEMFRCRFNAWKILEEGGFDPIQNVGDLFKSPKWTFEVSAVIHFFESLERYCERGLVDEELASQLFSRTFFMWYDGLLDRLIINDDSKRYALWVNGIQRLHKRMKRDVADAAKTQPPGPTTVAATA